MKTCCTCKQSKAKDQFSKCRSHKDGLASMCKSCASAYRKSWAEKNKFYLAHVKRVDHILKRDHYNESMRQRRLKQGREEETQKRIKRHRVQILEYSRQYRARHKEQIHASAMVQSAIKSGRLVKPDRCKLCNSPRNLRAHHYDYTKPLDVLWVCESCHRMLHSKEASHEAAISMAK
jgi:hypothetical protein